MKTIKDSKSTLSLSEKFSNRALRQWVIYSTGKFLSIGYGENYIADRLTADAHGVNVMLRGLLAQAAIRCQPMELVVLSGTLNQAISDCTLQPLKPLDTYEKNFSLYSTNLSLLTKVNSISYNAHRFVFITQLGTLEITTTETTLVPLIKAILDLTVPRVSDPEFLPQLLTFYRNAVDTANAERQAFSS